MEKPNICILSEKQQILGIGGTETVSYLLKEGLKKNDYNVWSAFFVQEAKLEQTDLLFPDKEDYHSTTNKNFFINKVIENRIKIVLLQGECDSFLMDICIEAKKHTDIKLVCAYHFNPLMRIKVYDDYVENLLNHKSILFKPLYKLYFKIKRKSFRAKTLQFIKNEFLKYDIENINAFVSLSKNYTDFIKGLYSTSQRDKFHTIENPIILDKEKEIYKKENIVLFVGRLTFQKRLDRFLYIWQKIYKKNPQWSVIVVGDGNYADEYKRLANNLQIKNITFVGQQPTEKYFKRSKIICMTSSHEGLPMVLIEAQKYGCVPIAYNSFGAATNIIENMYNGLLIEPFKQKEFIKALNHIISNEKIREQMAFNGIEYIEKFNIETIIQHWIRLFNEL